MTYGRVAARRAQVCQVCQVCQVAPGSARGSSTRARRGAPTESVERGAHRESATRRRRGRRAERRGRKWHTRAPAASSRRWTPPICELVIINVFSVCLLCGCGFGEDAERVGRGREAALGSARTTRAPAAIGALRERPAARRVDLRIVDRGARRRRQRRLERWRRAWMRRRCGECDERRRGGWRRSGSSDGRRSDGWRRRRMDAQFELHSLIVEGKDAQMERRRRRR